MFSYLLHHIGHNTPKHLNVKRLHRHSDAETRTFTEDTSYTRGIVKLLEYHRPNEVLKRSRGKRNLKNRKRKTQYFGHIGRGENMEILYN